MKIIFVRHGHPNYELDRLTELGHKHAEAVAERLVDEPIDKIYASTCGRAYETAEYICKKKNLPLLAKLDFMQELNWGPLDGTPDWEIYSPWKVSKEMVRAHESMLSSDWTRREGFAQSKVVAEVEKASKGFDGLLETLGYVREGEYYRVKKESNETVVVVSHGGSSCAVLAHLFNLTFPFVCNTFHIDFTGICEVRFTGKEGELITPRFGVFNDAKHIEGITV